MRAVAEYVMRGRNQALWVAVLSASSLMFAWLSASVLALVTLRRGPGEGAYILAWAVLPAGFVMAVFQDPLPLGMVLGTTGLAALLRWSVSWPLTLCGGSFLGVAIGIAMLIFGVNYLEGVAANFDALFAEWEAQLEAQGQQGIELQAPGIVTIAGMFGALCTLLCVLCLLLARWWQSSLYNPGGFREEFHALRMTPQVSSILVLLMLIVSSLGAEYRPWAVLFALPLSIAGLGLVHARAAYRNSGAGYLTLFYAFWILLDPVKLIVLGFALADSWINFRSRWQQKPKDEDLDND